MKKIIKTVKYFKINIFDGDYDKLLIQNLSKFENLIWASQKLWISQRMEDQFV